MRNLLSLLVLGTLVASTVSANIFDPQSSPPLRALHPPQDDSTFANID